MKAFFKLIRWPNLLIIILTMVLMRYAVIEPVLSKVSVTLYGIKGGFNNMTLQFPWYDFMILVMSIVCIAAGGYVINDYFDIKTDLINRGKVIVGTKIPRRQAMMWHNTLNMAGVAGGIYVSWKIGYLLIGILFLLVSGLLYFYSASYKRQFLVGNLVVAVLTSMVPMLVVIFEAPALYQFYAANAFKTPDLSIIYYWVGGFAVFVFLTTLTREIIKDIEDFEGDVAYGRNTVPVVIGILTSKIVAVSLTIITLGFIYLIWYFFLNDMITFIYLTAAVAAPLTLVIFQLITGKSRKQLHSASNMMNIVMLTGILYSVTAKIIITCNLF
jgi:4-hydroxybenzoate polyprenyltransferase